MIVVILIATAVCSIYSRVRHKQFPEVRPFQLVAFSAVIISVLINYSFWALLMMDYFIQQNLEIQQNVQF